MEEISNFCSHYFESHVQTNSKRVGRNDDMVNASLNGSSLSIFKHHGRPSGTCKHRYLDDEEYNIAIFYVLQNCEEIRPFFKIFEAELKIETPNITNDQVKEATEKRFGQWLRDYALNPINRHVVNDQIEDIAIGPSRSVRTWHMYYVNGFKFHTLHHNFGRKTSNTDVCVIGEEGDYYGRLIDIIELEYIGGSELNRIVLFKCKWYDPVKNRGWKVHNEFGLVDINHKRRLLKYDPFIMAHQATQVYFVDYPSLRRNRVDWLAVCRTKARSTIVAPSQSIELAYQEDSIHVPFTVTENDEVDQLLDEVGDMEEVEVYRSEDEVTEDEEEDEEYDEDVFEEEESDNDVGEDNYSDDDF